MDEKGLKLVLSGSGREIWGSDGEWRGRKAHGAGVVG